MSYIKDQSHGNYRHYYARRRVNDEYPLPLDQDERLSLLDPSLFKGKVVLDVGCNSGEVAVELAQRYQASSVIGVDIDSALIDQCQNTVEHAFSLRKPATSDDSSASSPITPNVDSREPTRKKRKTKNGSVQDGSSKCSTRLVDRQYFPAFFPEIYGPIDIRGVSLWKSAPDEANSGNKRTQRAEEPSDAPASQTAFPRNLVFYSADWTNTSIETDQSGYDVILGFSLTKWIHLHNLDEGLVKFFRKCYNSLNQGGVLILEKQSWKGYKQAKRSSQKLKQNYQVLKLRPETDFDRVLLEDIGFSKKETVKETETEKGFDRDIEMYWKLSTRLHPA